MSLIGAVERLEEFATKEYQDVIMYLLRNSVPHGGVAENLLPQNMIGLMCDLVSQEFITSVQGASQELYFVPTLRAIFLLSSSQYVECIASMKRSWDEFEKRTNVRVLSFGIIPQLVPRLRA